jgi:hypothetical protein
MRFTGAESLETRFAAVHYTRQAALLARLIHMETVHVRAAYRDNPTDGAGLYASSEFIHHLSGIIMVILYDDHRLDVPLLIAAIVETLGSRRRAQLDQFCEWVSQEEIEQ